MEKRVSRVSEAQWQVLLEFLERNPMMARARGYNNSAQGRAESARLWQQVADVLNAEGAGTTKTPKEWSIYVSNYKSKLKKIVADINEDSTATGGGPPRGSNISETDRRFLAILGPGFGLPTPRVSVNPFPDLDLQQPSSSAVPRAHREAQPSTSATPQALDDHQYEGVQQEVIIAIETEPDTHSRSGSPVHVEDRTSAPTVHVDPPTAPMMNDPPLASAATLPLPRRPRQTRHRSRPLAPLDEARRILSQVEMQRAASDAAVARALGVIGQNLGRLADVAETYVAHIRGPH